MTGDHMTDHAVVIVGSGPTGLMLAGELALAGTDVAVVERRVDQTVDKARAGGLHIRTLEVLDQRGIVDRFIADGQRYPSVGFAYIQLAVGDLPTRHSYLLGLPQSRSEPILADWVAELGVPILGGLAVVDVTQDDTGVTAELSDGSSLRAEYLVGCDGGRSLVRKAAGIDFPGHDPSVSFLIAEADTVEPPALGIRPEGGGIGPVDPGSEGGPYGFVVKERRVDGTTEPSLDHLRAELTHVYGTDFGVHSLTRISRFTDMSRQAATYRAGRVLLAGDAAHIHAPLGGQGLNTGVQDAVNLGWKLAQVVNGTSDANLLDTYHAERHPVGARVLHNTMAQIALVVGDERHRALHATVTELLAMDEPRIHVAAMIAALDVHYEMGVDPGRDTHPLLGRRMPDLDLRVAGAATRVYELLHDARPLLLDLGASDSFDIGPWEHRVRLVQGAYDGEWVLPVIGPVAPPAAVLIRPDGHVAWTGELADPGLPEALTTWFGPARLPHSMA